MKNFARLIFLFVVACAVAVQATYRAGHQTGRFVHWANDWLAQASRQPLATATAMADAVLAPAPAPAPVPVLTGPEMLALWQAEILTPARLAEEIREHEAPAPRKRPAARRKTAKAPRVKTAA